MAKKAAAKSESNGKFPMMAEVKGYNSRMLAIKLNNEEALNFHKLRDGLDAADARLQDGKHVENTSDVLRYLLQYAFNNSTEVRRKVN